MPVIIVLDESRCPLLNCLGLPFVFTILEYDR